MAASVRVLHVEDDRDFAELTAAYLERNDESFVVDHVTSPRAVLERLETDRIDCVISDYDMPEMNGIELLRAVRAGHADMPFVLFTGKGSEEVAEEAITAGVSDYLQKGTGTERFDLLARRIQQLVDRHRAERRAEKSKVELEEAYERIDLALEHTDSIVFEIDIDTGHVTRSGSYEEFFGRAPAAAPTWEDHLERVVHPADRTEFRTFYESLIAGERRSGTLEYRIDATVGGTRWMRADVYLQEREGTILGLAQDITESKQQARERERIIARATDAIVQVDADWRVTLLNEEAENVFDISEAEVRGSRLWDVLPAVEGTLFEDTFRAVMTHRESDSILRYCDPMGAYFDIHVYPNQDGGLAFYVTDVTDRLEREHDLQRYGQMLEQLQETTQHLIGADDVSEATDIVLESIEDVLAFDVVGIWRPAADAPRLDPVAITDQGSELIPDPPTYVPDEASLSWRAFEEQTSRVIDDVHEHSDRANPDTPIRSEIIVPLDDYGLINIGATEPGAFTEQDLALVELWAETVTSAIGRLTREQALRDREDELMRERNRLENFASIVSHDLRNPLGVAIGHLDMLSQEIESAHIDEIENALGRMDQLIDDLLELSQSGRRVGAFDPVDLGSLGSAAWSNVQTNGATLDIECDAAVLADRSRLQQVFENLFRNAVEHGAGDVQIRVGSVADGFFVADSGPGIPPDLREQVFEAGHSTSPHGTGLGLTIVKEIVEAHGWEMAVTGSPSGGARFEISGVTFAQG